MSNLIDPIAIMHSNDPPHVRNAEMATINNLPYEIPMTPPPGTAVEELTVGGTYRDRPIKVLFCRATRTVYPFPARES